MKRFATVVSLSFASAALAQSEMPAAAPQSRPVALVGARIEPAVAGQAPIERGFVVFDQGVITAVGAGEPASLPSGCQTVDCTGLTVLPGFVNLGSTLGLVEVLQVSATDDRVEFGGYHPEVRACVAVNPDSNLLPVARAGGVLTSCLFPQGGTVSGHASVMRLDGWTSEQLTVRPCAGLVVNWPISEPITASWMDKTVEAQKQDSAKQLKEIERFFDQAKAWADAHEADPKGTPGDLRFQNMVEAVRGREPVIFTANSPGSIESAVLWSLRRGMKPVIWGGAGAEQCLPLLAKHQVPVIVSGTHRLPRRIGSAIDDIYLLPARLHAAGVPFAIATGSDPSNERHLPDHAATAVAYGLPREVALRAITSGPAAVVGVGDRLGSIEPGKAATLQVVSGTPMEMTAEPIVAFIDGRRVDLGSHQSRLDAKYREKYRRMGLLPDAPAKP
jgi:Amidohydrolase family